MLTNENATRIGSHVVFIGYCHIGHLVCNQGTIVKKQIGNIAVEIHEATNNGQGFLVYLSVRTSTVKLLNLLPDDASDLVHGLQWALKNSKRKRRTDKELPSHD